MVSLLIIEAFCWIKFNSEIKLLYPFFFICSIKAFNLVESSKCINNSGISSLLLLMSSMIKILSLLREGYNINLLLLIKNSAFSFFLLIIKWLIVLFSSNFSDIISKLL